MASSRSSDVLPVPIDPHYSPQFYAELWGLSASTVTRWFQDLAGVLKLSKPPEAGGAGGSNCASRFPWQCVSTRNTASESKLGPMLMLQRRHSAKCPHRHKGPNFTKCRCPVWAGGIVDDKRVRFSLKTRDLRRAARRLVEKEQQGTARPRKRLAAAVEAFLALHEAERRKPDASTNDYSTTW